MWPGPVTPPYMFASAVPNAARRPARTTSRPRSLGHGSSTLGRGGAGRHAQWHHRAWTDQ